MKRTDSLAGILGSAATIAVTFNFTSAPPGWDTTQLLTLDKVTGQQQTLPLTPMGGGQAKLEVTLAAGDPVLFKYATGKGFVLDLP